MKIFVTGTDTDVGKTLVSAWLCLHANYSYFKPIQTGAEYQTDSHVVAKVIGHDRVYPESYVYRLPVAPYLAAKAANEEINIDKIKLPTSDKLIVEGAGGLFVPVNNKYMMVDLIQTWQLPVILVARSGLGTINHSLLSLNILRQRAIKVLGVILNGEPNEENKKAIESYGNIPILAEIPRLEDTQLQNLKQIKMPSLLNNLME